MSENEPLEIDRYEVVTLLALGGMGELYLARERGIGGFERLVAIKRILPRYSRDEEIREMFLREARILARLNHPNVVQTIELGEDEAHNYFLVLEYIHGSTLRELQLQAMARGHEFPIEVAVGVVIQGLRGLHATHELSDMRGNSIGLIHRDVSPHNLMCTPDGSVKLFDFGVAKATVKDELTYSGNLKGKFPYMSPEQCERLELDRRSDIFSMGIVLWELIAGHRLFRRPSELATMTAITDGDIPSLHDERDGVPDRLVEVVERALEVDPEARWQTAEAFSQALVDFAAEHDLDATPTRIAAFVEEVAGHRLEARMNSLAAAMERPLTEGERRDVAHDAASNSAPTLPDDSDQLETIRMSPLEIDVAQEPTVRHPALQEKAPDDSNPSPAGRGHGEDELETQGASRRPGRLRLVAPIVLIIGVVAAVAFSMSSSRPKGEPLQFAWAPVVKPEVLRSELEPIRVYLEQELDRPVELTVPESYDATAEQLLYGRIDIAALPPAMYVRTQAENEDIEPLATKVSDGSTGTDGLIIVPFESKATGLDDLRGATFCFSDENSTTGYLLPMAHIRGAGHDPDEFVGEIRWSGDHLSTLRDMLDGKCAAAGTNSGTLTAAGDSGIQSAKFRRLAITGSIPHGIVTAGPHLDAKTRETIATALLSFEPEEHTGQQAVGETQRITGFAPPDRSAYAALRDALKLTD